MERTDTITVEALAEEFGLSPATAIKRCTSGVWPFHKEGRHVYFTAEDREQIIAAGAVQVRRATGQTARSSLAQARKAS